MDQLRHEDGEGGGHVNFDQFLHMMRVSMEHDPEDELRGAFTVFDKDRDGFITRTELISVLSALGENLTEQEVTDMVQSADHDGMGGSQDSFSGGGLSSRLLPFPPSFPHCIFLPHHHAYGTIRPTPHSSDRTLS